MLIEKTVKQWHQLLIAQNPSQLKDLLSDDVIFHSPVLHTPQKGKALATMYLSAAFYVIANDTFKYRRQILQDNHAMLEFETTLDGILVNGIDIIECDDKGKIIDFKVMVRPLKGLQIVQQKMFELLKQSQPSDK